MELRLELRMCVAVQNVGKPTGLWRSLKRIVARAGHCRIIPSATAATRKASFTAMTHLLGNTSVEVAIKAILHTTRLICACKHGIQTDIRILRYAADS